MSFFSSLKIFTRILFGPDDLWESREDIMWYLHLNKNQIKSNETIYSFTRFLQILVYTNKNKMAKYLQWKIMCGGTTCKETLYKTGPHKVKIKNKLKHIIYIYIYIYIN